MRAHDVDKLGDIDACSPTNDYKKHHHHYHVYSVEPRATCLLTKQHISLWKLSQRP